MEEREKLQANDRSLTLRYGTNKQLFAKNKAEID